MPKDQAKQWNTVRDFGKWRTADKREGLSKGDFSYLLNVVSLGPGNLRTIPASILANTLGSATFPQGLAVLNFTNPDAAVYLAAIGRFL